uniref:Uncharacterized protein n=1 Tax=Arundo donax TaxID=35708 RepID=A0A0A9A8L4_ARUDO
MVRVEKGGAWTRKRIRENSTVRSRQING